MGSFCQVTCEAKNKPEPLAGICLQAVPCKFTNRISHLYPCFLPSRGVLYQVTLEVGKSPQPLADVCLQAVGNCLPLLGRAHHSRRLCEGTSIDAQHLDRGLQVLQAAAGRVSSHLRESPPRFAPSQLQPVNSCQTSKPAAILTAVEMLSLQKRALRP